MSTLAFPDLSPSPSPSLDGPVLRRTYPPPSRPSLAVAWPASPAPPDALDAVVSYLKKRDGVDKVLKILRYVAKFLVAASPDPAAPSLARARAFDAAVGDARKAYRLGKFLQGVNELRRLDLRAPSAPLAALAAAGDSAYYFLEQFTWLIRAGVIDKRYARRVARAAAAAELLGYAGSASLAALRVAAASEREAALLSKLAAVASVDAAVGGAASSHDGITCRTLEAELASVAAARRAAERALLQDACDSLLAVSDLTGGRGGVASSKTALAVAGLTSAVLGARKAWGK